MIKFKQTNVIPLENWDGLITETYNRPYSFQQQNGCRDRELFEITVPEETSDFKNDTMPEEIHGREMGVSFNAWLARDPKEWNGSPEEARFLDLFWERNFYPHHQMVANDLYAKGLIPAGDYAIEIDW